MDQKDLIMKAVAVDQRIADEQRQKQADALRAQFEALEPAKPKRRMRKAPAEAVEVDQDAG
jgi:hypothetical protein